LRGTYSKKNAKSNWMTGGTSSASKNVKKRGLLKRLSIFREEKNVGGGGPDKDIQAERYTDRQKHPNGGGAVEKYCGLRGKGGKK